MKKSIIVLIAFLLLIGLSSCGQKRNELVKGQSEYMSLGPIEAGTQNENNEGDQENQNNSLVSNQENQGSETSDSDTYIPSQYRAFFYDFFRFEVVDIEFGFKDRKNRDACILYVIFKENYNTCVQHQLTTAFDRSFSTMQQIYQWDIEESGEIETYSRLCVSSKVVHLFKVGKEYIAQGGTWSKVKTIDGEQISCMDLTFSQYGSTALDIIKVDCLAEVDNGKVYPKEFSYGVDGLHMSLYQIFLDFNQLIPEEQSFTSGGSCEEFISWFKYVHTYYTERSKTSSCTSGI